MTTRQLRRAAERAARKQARKTAQQQQQPSAIRAEINRANAQKSTGPKSEEGKARSSRNSFKHGLYSKQLVTSDEDAAALDALKADLRAEHEPVNETEEILVNELAEQYWRLRRARALEAALLDSDNVLIPHLTAIQRMMSSAERGFHKALTALRQLQKDRGFVPAKSQPAESPEPIESTAPPLKEPRPQGSGTLGFVPPSRPEELDSWERPQAGDSKPRMKQNAA